MANPDVNKPLPQLAWDNLEPGVQNSFKTPPQPVLATLRPGFQLYRFNTYNTLTGPGSTNLPRFWAPYLNYDWAAGLGPTIQMAKNTGAPVEELARILSAIADPWNGMNYVLIITLQNEVQGWFGQCAGQHKTGQSVERTPGEKPLKGHLPGCGPQFFIDYMSTQDATLTQCIPAAQLLTTTLS